MMSQAMKSPGQNTVFLESSKARVIVNNSAERSSFHLDEPQRSKRNFNFSLPKSLSFMSRRDAMSSTEIESPERELDRRAWLRIEREKARKELRLDQDGDVTETTTASEFTSFDSSTPKHASPLRTSPSRTSSYSMALNIPAPPVESPRRRDGKQRRGRRSQLRESIVDDGAAKEEDTSLSPPSRGVLRQSGGNLVEATPISPDDSECVNASVSSPRRPRRRSVGPGHRDKKKDVTTTSHVSCETPSRRPRRRSLGPSRRQLVRPLDLTSDETSALNSGAKTSSRPSHHASSFDFPEDDAPPNTQQRRSRHPSRSRNLSELSDELPVSPRRRLQTRKVKKINNEE